MYPSCKVATKSVENISDDVINPDRNLSDVINAEQNLYLINPDRNLSDVINAEHICTLSIPIEISPMLSIQNMIYTIVHQIQGLKLNLIFLKVDLIFLRNNLIILRNNLVILNYKLVILKNNLIQACTFI